MFILGYEAKLALQAAVDLAEVVQQRMPLPFHSKHGALLTGFMQCARFWITKEKAGNKVIHGEAAANEIFIDLVKNKAGPDDKLLMSLAPYAALLTPDQEAQVKVWVSAAAAVGSSAKSKGSRISLGLVKKKALKCTASASASTAAGSNVRLDLFDLV